VGQSVDIWSLGCLYLEFIIWVLYGSGELERFREDLEKFGGKDGARFYTISDTKNLQVEGSRQVVEVNQVVKAWIEHIKTDLRCTGTRRMQTAVGNLIVLIEEGMLVVNANSTSSLAPNMSVDAVDGNKAITASRKGTVPIPGFIIKRATTRRFNEDNQKTNSSQTAKSEQTEEPERAEAIEVYDDLDRIVRGGRTGVIEWIHNPDRLDTVSYNGPESMTYLTMHLHRASLDKSEDVSAINFHPLTAEWF